MERIAVLDYGASNLRSVVKALQAVASTGQEIHVTSNPADLRDAGRIVLPGQGAFNQLSAALHGHVALLDALQTEVMDRKKPYLGICLGMQILADEGDEHGTHKGLGWIKGRVKKLALSDKSLKIPHMGWNDIIWQGDHALRGEKDDDFYFAHSYVFDVEDRKDVLGLTDYGGTFASAVARDNITGIQAHPEKSGAAGLEFLRHFLHWKD